MLDNLFRTKPIAPAGHVDAGEPFEGSLQGEVTLKRTLTGTQLILLGIGAVIGAGIFVLTGQAAAEYAGPAVMLSFVLAGLACAFAGLCYAEFAAMLPVSGSAYSYSYATLGEGVAWFIGWCLVLEYLFAASTVAVGWSGYLNAFLGNFGAQLPEALASAPYVYEAATGKFVGTGAILNLPAVLIIAAVSGVGYVGISQSAFVNSIIVAIKVTVIVMFIGFGLQYVDPSNWEPFIPANEGGTRYGMEGVIRASAVVFFAYIGFDAVSTAAGEAKNPQRDMPIGILGSLAVCTLLYILMSAVLTGMMPFAQLGTPEPVSTALNNYPALGWLQTLVEIAAIAGLASVILVMLMAQPRIFYSMAQDGLMPKMFGRCHPKYRTPHIGTVIVGVIAALLAGLLPVGFLGDIVSMGTLLAFAVVSIGVLILRYTRPNVQRPFKVPFALLICPLGFLSCMYLFWQVFREHWHLLVGWLVIGAIVYALYGYRHSKLRAG
ncbi:amino acid permease [Cognatiluteimonas lumbrici]|uniref:amino acid permease n=1 Tax=Cognatiluteimonas lumbrici TaxID=2559601 RepID=UPI0011274015|nr:amino acid permease [Luteimonas lumbrici]